VVVNIKKANDGQIMIITEHGITIRCKVDNISVIGRNVQGVRLVRLEEGDKVAAIAHVIKGEEDDSAVQEALPQEPVEE
jgi:DNA gyrase subunit A